MISFKQFPVHDTFLWKFQDVKKGGNKEYIKSYYHDLTDFLPYHTHDFYEINIVCNGVGKHFVEQREILTQKGDIFIIPPHVKHGYSCHDNLTVYHILLSNSFMTDFGPFFEKLSGYKMLFNIEPLLRSRIEKAYYLKAENISFDIVRQHIQLIEYENNEKSKENEFENACHVLSLIATLSKTISVSKSLQTKELPDSHVLTLIESIEYIENHFDRKLNYKKLAAKCAMSYSTYLRLFKKISGVTPTEYQLDCRLNKAAALLRNSGETVLSIALSCGFYDSSHFIREFIKKTHCSPVDFRNLQKKK